ncbi:phosphoadenosine phosphosulfate reductase family protein [Desulfovibrio inopinatus]|uniref:phosphoadenosine phosphosulfate reductase family protein n=1 Tax=Desulfovibrio inopinatus TaxID=102109 RepID=UPI0003FD682E
MNVNVVSISGGVDSTATALLAIERMTPNLRFVFADTGNEHPLTLEYIGYLENVFKAPIMKVKADFSAKIETRRRKLVSRIKDRKKTGWTNKRLRQALWTLTPTGNPFLDMCLYHSRFPSATRRFCSGELKVIPIQQAVFAVILDNGDKPISWQGIRWDESPRRALLPMHEEGEIDIYRPIASWSKKKCFDYLAQHGVEPNPLYKMGMHRVGCMPCIFARKAELSNISRMFPEELDRISRWERRVSLAARRGISSFFSYDKTPRGKNSKNFNNCTVYHVANWATTNRNGQASMLDILPQPECVSEYGLCE